MNENEITEKMMSIFGHIFLLAQRWQYLGDRELSKDNLTTKQWFLLAYIGTLFKTPPTLTQVTEVLGTSRQNIKQIALNLEKRGFLEIKPDENDRRILRFKITQKSNDFWDKRADRDEKYVADLFKGLSEEEIELLYVGITKLNQRADDLFHRIRK
jgi:DNA-binding MarR family transcriptional regulator